MLGFKRIGAEREAEIMVRAITSHAETKAWFDGFKSIGTDEAFRQSCRECPLRPLDHEFWDLNSDLEALRVRFIRADPEQFLGRRCDEG